MSNIDEEEKERLQRIVQFIKDLLIEIPGYRLPLITGAMKFPELKDLLH